MPAYAVVELMYVLGASIGLSLLFVTAYFLWESAKDFSRPLKDARDCCSSCQSKYSYLQFKYKVLKEKYEVCSGWDRNGQKKEEDEE